jgi:catechol 2,3-dioxygenase-like lactoylglutathione lyase family enzyme
VLLAIAFVRDAFGLACSALRGAKEKMEDSADRLPTGGFAPLVPELDVFDLEKSKRFWCDILGFQIAYRRPENGFVYLELQRSQVMLCQRNGKWETGNLDRPLGRGINFQMFVASVDPMLGALERANWPLFEECHVAGDRIGDKEKGSRQFLVQDPDGYLLRFAQDLGDRPTSRR